MSEININDLGFPADYSMFMRTPVARRRILRMGMAGIATLLAGCNQIPGIGGGPGGGSTSPNASTAAGATACNTVIPSETNGPYPADGANASGQTLNVLTKSGIVRSDIRTSLGTGKTAAGVPLNYELTLVNTKGSCAPLAGYALYVWQCDALGNYSMYSNGYTNEDYCRGVQATDASGKAAFKAIFPGCYPGRWPHLHFEIFKSLTTATGPNGLLHTSQLALPEDVSKSIYSGSGYGESTRNLSQLTLATDNVFRDGANLQVATVTGDASAGYTAKLTIGIAV